MDFEKVYEQWKNFDGLDGYLKDELVKIEGNREEIEDRFYKTLEFGTAGLRGVLGAGTNRMNVFTVRQATAGLAEYIKKTGHTERGVVIAYDSRHFSPEFALEAAKVLCANNIKVYLFESLRPTPELSFSVRHLHCIAGIVITASHNPAKYNGYKVYGEDGGQMPLDAANAVTEEIRKTDMLTGPAVMDEKEAVEKGLLTYIGEDVDREYLANVFARRVNPEAVAEVSYSFSIVYTPFHGSGNKLVQRILRMSGLKNLYVVREQEEPDGDFPTVKSPNPEDKEGFKLAIELAKKNNTDLIIGTDPDSDRVGMMEVLTGFKFIGEKIKEFEADKSHSFVFGFEESYGYLSGTYARDKDAVVASMLIVEMAAWYKKQGMTLYDAMQKLYKKYGWYSEGVISIVEEGIEGPAKIAAMINKLRTGCPKEIAGLSVDAVRDYSTGIITRKDGSCGETKQPKNNMLYLELENGAGWLAVRPSGTEPKLKLYFGLRADDKSAAEAKLAELMKDTEAKIR